MIEIWFCLFKSSRLSVALTLLSASILIETGDTLFAGINQLLEISHLKCIHKGGIFLARFKFELDCWYTLAMCSTQLERSNFLECIKSAT